ncbi:hypothetical protein [Acinetobacter sp. ESBL14]|uniref:hypothetical protein n=1 Tax=Acinetobacter sp. ESBL14 TaxID=3077329 RepID=UPI002FC64C9D
MNQLELRLDILGSDQKIYIDNIEFSNCALIKLKIDSRPIEFTEEAMIVFSELLKSINSDGKFLIFTDASGIADDGGWEGVVVKHYGEKVVWNFEYEDENFHIEFSTENYEDQILNLKSHIDKLPSHIILEPQIVFFPEQW